MVGSVNNSAQQQPPVFKSLNPGISEDREPKNPVEQVETRPSGTSVSEAQPSETRNLGSTKEELNGKIIQTGRDDSLLTRSDARGNNLDITV